MILHTKTCNNAFTTLLSITILILFNLIWDHSTSNISHSLIVDAFSVGQGKLSSSFLYRQPRCTITSNRTEIRRRSLLFENHFITTGAQLCLSIENDQEETKEVDDAESDIIIREVYYSDLTAVTKMIVNAFYDPSPLLRHYYFFKELDRLQSNFPYDNDNHAMYVACARSDSTVVGFVDVDCRPSKGRHAPPRPYLSDLVVDVDWRRRGIAKKLVKTCENMVKKKRKGSLHLRVEFKNEAAMRMYHSLGYTMQTSDIFGVIDTTILLKRDFDYEDEYSPVNRVKSNDGTPIPDYTV